MSEAGSADGFGYCIAYASVVVVGPGSSYFAVAAARASWSRASVVRW